MDRDAPHWRWYLYIPQSRHVSESERVRICDDCYVDLLEERTSKLEQMLESVYMQFDLWDRMSTLVCTNLGDSD